MASRELMAAVSLPRIRKEHPQQVKIVATDPRSADSASTACQVCHVNRFRYTCPKCRLPYCSVACYQAHNNNGGGDDCTESFYQERVSQVVRLEVQAKKEQTQQLIQKVYNQRQQVDEEQSDSHEAPPCRFSQDKLLEILQAIEAEEEGTDSASTKLNALVSPEIQQSLQHAIRTGLVHEWILEPWHPWWKPELVAAADDDDGQASENEEGEDARLPQKTLDERLVEDIVPFSKLRPATAVVPDLQWNLVDLVHAVVTTLYLYHGATNASCRDNCANAAHTLVQTSSVLSQDARWTCLEQVLLECHAREARHHESLAAGPLHDVALVCTNSRLTARALLEGIDILRAAIRRLRTEERQPLKRHVKKMEFYLSWLQHVNFAKRQDGGALGRDIAAWLAEWDPSEVDNPAVTAMQRHHLKAVSRETRREGPLIKEVEADCTRHINTL